MSLLPSYSSSCPLPDYSSDPAQDERRLVYQRRPQYDHGRDGIYLHKEDKVTLLLANQRQGTSLPEYGRRAIVSGSIILDDPHSIEEVKLELKCRVEFLTLAQGFLSREISRISHVLYDRQQAGDACPSSLPFSCVYPSAFRSGNASHPLPPTFDETLYEENAQYARVSHSLSVLVTKTRGRKAAALLGKNKHSLQPISCQLFLPSVGVFEMRETIPFHIQLVSSSATLSRLVQGGDQNHPPVKVTLGRQLILETDDRRFAVNFVLGKGKVSFSPGFTSSQDRHEGVLNFEGQVCLDSAKDEVPSFDSGMIAARDFIRVELAPKVASTATLFSTFKHAHVVKLVTDPWSDAPDPFGYGALL
ncbi:hypothetical protein AAF712_005602 [Marasmius tenuissimus]|uniref:Arrestin-like N-terminal domain-containing protein n=1 Tax=Marasmius tenuissimus TaxID=585030 RepID=A0ABR3A2X4_9AGAR